MLTELATFLVSRPKLGQHSRQTLTSNVPAWRGVLIDSARSFYPPSTIKLVLDLMARYGFNYLHWHLTDDQGWRFEVPKYPRLTQVSAYLPRDSFQHYGCLAPHTLDGSAEFARQGGWQNGYYTDAQIKDLVSYAQKLGITIVPEVDLPGHMEAVIKAYPELGRPESALIPEGSMRAHMYWPARNDLLWPVRGSLDFVGAILDRAAQLFPGPYLHLGGDECAFKQWEADPGLEPWMAAHGIQDGRGIQRWFMDFAIERVRKLGKILMAWDEACEFVDSEVLILAWQEQLGMERVDNASQKYVYADARELYFCRVDPQAQVPQLGMLPAISVRDVLTHEWTESYSSRCIGVQACFWSEFILNQAMLLNAMFPRLLAVAARVWHPDLSVDRQIELVDQEFAALKQVLPDSQPLTVNS